LRIKHVKGTENTQADTLSRKPGYKEKQKPEDSSIFREDGDDLILKRQLASTTRVDNDPFTDKIKTVYNNNKIAENIP
jgi:hypothetical protein